MAKVRFVDEIPPPGQNGVWVERLRPLVANPNRPAIIFTAESAEQAGNAVDNLNRRRVFIPRPDHDWVFMSRENVVYAIYKGPGRSKITRARVRRAK